MSKYRIGVTIMVMAISTALFLVGIHIGTGNEKHQYKTFTIIGSGGMSAKFSENGARLMELKVPGRHGKLVDVVFGYDDPVDYDSSTEPYYGATIGRFGNRIAKGKFTLDNKVYQLSVNNGSNTLHGGKTGFQYQKWTMETVGDSSLVCTLVAPHGENGFPGNLSVTVRYTLTANNALQIDYRAKTDRPTIVNLTNHAFFNLNGSGSIVNHHLIIDADTYLPVDSTLIPTGEFRQVGGGAFDFRNGKNIGSDIGDADQQLSFGNGYDHNFVLNKNMAAPCARVRGDKSGIIMEIYTDQPGLQFYSGNFMKSENRLRTGPDHFRNAFCLETQHFPDSPNRSNFPITVLRPGEIYRSTSRYVFSTE